MLGKEVDQKQARLIREGMANNDKKRTPRARRAWLNRNASSGTFVRHFNT